MGPAEEAGGRGGTRVGSEGHGGVGWPGVASAAARGVVAGAIGVGAGWAFLAWLFSRSFNSLDEVFGAIVLLTFVPAVVVLASVGACVALRVPLGWLVGIVAPVLAVGLLGPLPSTLALQLAFGAATYGAVAAGGALLKAALPTAAGRRSRC